MPRSIVLSVLVMTTTVLVLLRNTQSFTPCRQRLPNRRLVKSELFIGDMLGGLFGQKEGGSSGSQGGKSVVNLPVTNIKQGPLKFFLQIYLVAQQNSPTKGSWVLNNNEESSLDMYYKDGTGMFSIQLNDKNIQIIRNGERQSLEYLLQESVMIHGILDELNSIALEVEDIEKEKRLVQLEDDAAISKARESLPARKEA